jgi:hypothetical protein
MKLKLILAIMMASLFSSMAQAQCASGASAGSTCVPPPDQSYSPLNPSNQVRQQPRAVWADRWGAIAYDSVTGDAGTIEGQQSKSMARQIAMSYCEKTGAQHCKILYTFSNACAAAAVGGGRIGFAGSPTNKEQAEQQAIAQCGRSDTCKIVYSACSPAQRIQ